MANRISVQLHGVEDAVSVTADHVREEFSDPSIEPVRLRLMLDGNLVAEFKMLHVDGWRMESGH